MLANEPPAAAHDCLFTSGFAACAGTASNTEAATEPAVKARRVLRIGGLLGFGRGFLLRAATPYAHATNAARPSDSLPRPRRTVFSASPLSSRRPRGP